MEHYKREDLARLHVTGLWGLYPWQSFQVVGFVGIGQR